MGKLNKNRKRIRGDWRFSFNSPMGKLNYISLDKPINDKRTFNSPMGKLNT